MYLISSVMSVAVFGAKLEMAGKGTAEDIFNITNIYLKTINWS